MSGQWEGARSRGLPKDWPKTRRRILERDAHRCVWPTHTGTCGQPATDVDHVGDRNNHSDTNLRSLCAWHHRKRTGSQGGSAAKGRHVTMRRASEQHPGLR